MTEASSPAATPNTACTKGLVVIHTIESTHCGSGLSGDGIDKLIVRDIHTRWPKFRETQMKGAFRSACCDQEYIDQYRNERDEEKRKKLRRSEINTEINNTELKKLTAVFGPREITKPEDSQSGAFKISPARMLAFPVCSARGVFAWVTCPEALLRLRLDLMARGMETMATGLPDAYPELAFSNGQAIFDSNTSIAMNGRRVRLGELVFNEMTGHTDLFEKVATWFEENARNAQTLLGSLRKRLVLVSNEAFTNYVRFSTEAVQRNALDYDTKTVEGGLLFSMELLPPETLLYATVEARDERTNRDNGIKAVDIFNYVHGKLSARNFVMQFGADESKDCGVCILTWRNCPRT